MSVLKSKRKPSQFEVFHHLNKMRKEVTDLLLRDFGYDLDKAVKKVETTFGGRPYEELSPDEKVRYEKLMEKNTAFAELKKLAPKLTEKEFTDFYKSWFKNHYKIMSKKQRSNMDTLFNQLKEVTKCTLSPLPMAQS